LQAVDQHIVPIIPAVGPHEYLTRLSPTTIGNFFKGRGESPFDWSEMKGSNGSIQDYTLEWALALLKMQFKPAGEGRFACNFGTGGGGSSDGDDPDPITPDPEAGEGSFVEGVVDGFGAGVGSTVDFFKSLTTIQGWSDMGSSLSDLAKMANPLNAEGAALNAMVGASAASYVQSIPDKSAYELGHDIRFGVGLSLYKWFLPCIKRSIR
jgi:hypothetical protein